MTRASRCSDFECSPARNCFVSIPQNIFNEAFTSLSSLPIIRILPSSTSETTRSPIFATAVVSPANKVEISQDFVELAEIPCDTKSLTWRPVSLTDGLHIVADRVDITVDQWEIVALQSEVVQSTLLDQIRVVSEGLSFPLWLPGNFKITCTVASVMPPSDFVILQAMTEVVVLPAASTPGSTRTLQDIPDASEREKRLLPSYVRLRVHPVDSGDIPPGFVLVSSSFWRVSLKLPPSLMYFPCTVKSVMHPEAGTASPEGCVLVQIGDEASVLKRDSPYPLPHGVASFSTIGADWTLLELNALTVPQDSVTSISLRVDKQGNDADRISSFRRELMNTFRSKIVGERNRLVLVVGSRWKNGLITKIGRGQKAGWIAFNEVKDLNVSLVHEHEEQVDEIHVKKRSLPCNLPSTDHTGDLVVSEDSMKLLLRDIAFSLDLTDQQRISISPGNVSVTFLIGLPGSGRTTLSLQAARTLERAPYYVATFYVSCGKLAEKKVPSVINTLENVASRALLLRPSLIILDDFDVLIPNSGALDIDEGTREEGNTRADYHDRLAEAVRQFLQEHSRVGGIAFLAITESSTSAHALLRLSSIDVISLLPPNQASRSAFLRHVLRTKDDLPPELVGDLRMAGFLPSDLEALAAKAILLCSQKSCSENPSSIVDCLREVLEDFVPSHLRSVGLSDPGPKDLKDIGGLRDAKHRILEALEFPAKYPEYFRVCNLPIRCGILLYGLPGTGKTILAKAVAKELGVNFISIKGPELLSKYVGASEENVRRLFERAAAAKPCLIFFDEFEALAPRRGHDNTGVTDRVVNQLLTALDGLESLDGVFVIAASSRPDLIDPAILRSGRIDIHILCDLPDEDERLSILRVLCSCLPLEDGACSEGLSLVAQKSEGFTGADLQAVLYNAQLQAVQSESKTGDFLVTTECLFDALADTSPSISGDQRNRFSRQYRVQGTISKKKVLPITPDQKVTFA